MTPAPEVGSGTEAARAFTNARAAETVLGVALAGVDAGLERQVPESVEAGVPSPATSSKLAVSNHRRPTRS